MTELRKGFTTGTAAAAATKAAIYQMAGQAVAEVTVTLPNGAQLVIPVQESGVTAFGAYYAEVIKDGGDDPDITNGAIIRSLVRQHGPGITINGGSGVGRVTKPGLPVALGEAAIKPVPRRMICQAITESPIKNDLEVTIEVPRGAELAVKTLNPRLGILDGISILGTSGIVEPMSNEAWQVSLVSQLQVIRAAGFLTVVLTPGRQGLNWATAKGIPEVQIAEMSNFVGYMLEQCAEKGFQAVLLWGHYGKLVKLAAGNYDTHSRMSDAKLETLTAITAVCGGTIDLIKQIFYANTTEEAVGYLTARNLDRIVLDQVAERATQRALMRVKNLLVGCVLLDHQGRIRGSDQGAQKIVEAEQWQINW
jgi:cobalt-precorrin-5B (C1)-methyltransferase